MTGPEGTILLTGATGLVGGRLLPALLDRGVAVRALSRTPRPTRLDPRAELVVWDGRTPPAESLEGVAAVVHLAGEPIFAGPLTRGRRGRIWASRVDSTRALVDAFGRRPADSRPRTLLCASAVGYYGSRGEELLDERAAAGEGFLADLCRAWETAAAAATGHGVRSAWLRTGIVLAREGGALAPLARLFRLGLGGRLGDGRQWVPWIHIDDLVALACAILEDPSIRGAVNAVAPEPVRNAELTRALGRALGRPAILPVPGFVVRAALGELAGELLGSRRLVPRAAQEMGFDFRHSRIDSALEAELN